MVRAESILTRGICAQLTYDEANDDENGDLQVVDNCEGFNYLLAVLARVFFELTLGQTAQLLFAAR